MTLARNRILIGSILFFLLFASQISAQDTIQQVKAMEGDGIYSLLRRQGLDPVKYYKDFVELNSESLTENNQLYVGNIYQIPYSVSSEEKVKPEVVENVEYSNLAKIIQQ